MADAPIDPAPLPAAADDAIAVDDDIMADIEAEAAEDDAEEDPNEVPFALTPGQMTAGILDYSTGDGRKVYFKATAALLKEPYLAQADQLTNFLNAIDDRAREYGWHGSQGGILDVPKDPSNPEGGYDDILSRHGTISLERVRQAEAAYIGNPVRAAQDTTMLYYAIINSLSLSARSKVMIWRDQFTVQGRRSGVALLKVLIRESHLDTNATTTSIRIKLSSLDDYIVTINCNITKFNAYVKNLVEALTARGERTTDLLTNLFKGYLAATDETFGKYIARKQEEYEEGTSALEPDELMELANNRYKTLLEKGKWNAPSETEEKIIALETQFRKMQQKTKKPKTGDGKKGKFEGGPKKGPKHNAKGGKGKKKTKELPVWMKQPPPASLAKIPVKVDDKEYHWCHPSTGGKCPGVWRRHKPAECMGSGPKAAQKDNAQMRLKKALEARINQTESSDEE